MVARIDWLNDSIERMLVGRSPVTPSQWQSSERIIERDMELLKHAAALNTLRPGASDPDPRFIAQLRDRIALEAGS